MRVIHRELFIYDNGAAGKFAVSLCQNKEKQKRKNSLIHLCSTMKNRVVKTLWLIYYRCSTGLRSGLWTVHSGTFTVVPEWTLEVPDPYLHIHVLEKHPHGVTLGGGVGQGQHQVSPRKKVLFLFRLKAAVQTRRSFLSGSKIKLSDKCKRMKVTAAVT